MRKPITDNVEDADFSGLVDAALEIAKSRAETERQIKELLEQGKDQEALALMRTHLNVSNTPKRKRRAKG